MSDKSEIKDPKKKGSNVRKSIAVDGNVHKILKNLKNELSAELGGRITFNMVIKSLIQDSNDLQNVKSELKRLQQETMQTQDYIKEMLKLALSSQGSTQIVAVPANGSSMLPPAPPKRLAPPKKRRTDYKPPNSGHLKKDFVNEINQLFVGESLKPSDILKITKPKHKDAEIKNIEENQQIPDIFEHSTAKRFPPRKIEEKANV
ncbi:MAG: hypothetical protein GF364_04405 [Candidatus Lokiarchaeota archaeon]|nr:hypothetical protein [Candidatus Lokiarchaeota archaeon]